MSQDDRGMHPWWSEVGAAEPDANRTRALGWLNGTYATTAINVRLAHDEDREAVKNLFRWAVTQDAMPAFEEPIEMEHWLSGLLVGCLATRTWPGKG